MRKNFLMIRLELQPIHLQLASNRFSYFSLIHMAPFVVKRSGTTAKDKLQSNLNQKLYYSTDTSKTMRKFPDDDSSWAPTDSSATS